MEEERILTTSDRAAISYRLWRPGPPRRLLVLVHGMGSNMTRWSELLHHTTLKDDWDILRLDLRGHGRSMYRGRLGMEVWCRDIAEIMEREGYGKAVVAGHSLGALIALWFAHLYPARTDGLILVEPSFPQAMRGSAHVLRRYRWLVALATLIIRGLSALRLRRRGFEYRSLWEWDKRARKDLLNQGAREEMVKLYTSPWVDLKYNPLDNYAQDMLQVLRPRPRLATITCPVLTLLSADTEYTDRDETDKILARLPNNETEVLHATHWIMTETPEEARAAIEAWCEKMFEKK